jgi:DNA-binding transcriptional regulator YbjK
MDTTAFFTRQASLERARIVSAAQVLLLERGIGEVELVDVAVSLRIPVAAVARQFPAGMPTLVQASLEAHLHDIHTQLLAQRQECGSAVEELLAMRRLLLQQIGDTRDALLQLRATFTLDYMQENLRRGIREGYFRPDLPVENQAREWLAQVNAVVEAAHTASELTEAYYAHFDRYLANITTPVGSYAVRRLQETPPYY